MNWIDVMLIILAVVIYLLPLWRCKWWLNKAYSMGGIWESSNPTFAEVVAILIPGVNSLVVISLLLIGSPYKIGQEHWSKKAVKFFKIRNLK